MKVTAVIPVFNEEYTVGNVIDTISGSILVDRVIVVDDGSADKSPEIVGKFGKNPKVRCMVLAENHGKGNAVRIATARIKSGILLFIDADLMGLNHAHIEKILDPIIKKKAAMSIGLRDKGNFISNLVMPYFPLNGGERAILAEEFAQIRKCSLIEGWGLESVMNDYCRKKRLPVKTVRLDGLNHIGLQTRKYGLLAFLKEIKDVIITKIKLISVKYE